MFNKVLLTLSLIVNALTMVASYKYSVDIHDEGIFNPCNSSDVYFFDNYVDMSNVKYEYLSNGSIYANGVAVFTRDLGTDSIGEDTFNIQVFRKNRDTWNPTIYNIKRNDVCMALFNPADIFYQYLRKVRKENQKCPFFVNQEILLDVIANLELDIPDPKFAGEYLANIMVHFKGLDEYFCTNIYGEFFRS